MSEYEPVRRADRRAPARRSPWLRVVTTGVLLGAATVVGLAAWNQGIDLTDPSELGHLFQRRAYVEVDGRAVAVPRPAPADGRLAPAVPVTTTGDYAFLHTDDEGRAVGYDPCRPVRWVLRDEGAPQGGDALVEDAVATIAAATGLVFEYGGTTDEAPDLDRPIIQERYGTDWAPVLVAWATAAEVPELSGQVAGIGGSADVPGATGSGEWLAAGRLVLDSEDLGAMIAAGNGGTARAVILHELAHVVGLDHVDDPSELMNPTTTVATGFGPGDLAGLALVGQATCQ